MYLNGYVVYCGEFMKFEVHFCMCCFRTEISKCNTVLNNRLMCCHSISKFLNTINIRKRTNKVLQSSKKTQ